METTHNGDQLKEAEDKNLALRRLDAADYSKGFMELLGQLSVFGPVSNHEFFSRFEELQHLGSDHFICVIEDLQRAKIVGTGTILIEKKFLRSCGKVGHIEDVVVDSSVRGKHLGQKIVKFMTAYAKLNGCYKVILDSNVENKGFYEKCGFDNKDLHMALYFG